jgi:hypothetical protein
VTNEKTDIQEQYLMELSRQCYALMQDQINKRNTVIGFWTTVTVIVYTALFTMEPSPMLINYLLGSFFVAGFLYCNVIFGLISWQNTYKKSCDVIGKIVMNKENFKNTEDINKYIYNYFKRAEITEKSKNRIKILFNSTSKACFGLLLHCFHSAIFAAFYYE